MVPPELQESFIYTWDHCESLFDNAEWYYRKADSHGLSGEYEVASKENRVLLCGWKDCSCKSRCKLREQLRSHTQKKVVSCPNCDGKFSNNTKFHDYIRWQTPLDQHCFQCTHCSNRLATERLMRDPMRKHVYHYKFTMRDMTCPLPSTLRTHIRFRHSDERP